MRVRRFCWPLCCAGVILLGSAALAAPGDLDRPFGKVITKAGTGRSHANDVVILADSSIVAGGGAQGPSGSHFTLVHYTEQGNRDKAFGTKGVRITPIGTESDILALALQSDGKIVAAGWAAVAGETHLAIARYHADGTLDTGFDGDGIVTTPVGAAPAYAFDVAVDGNGSIVVVGHAFNGSDFDILTARYTSAGAPDSTFSGDGIDLRAIGTATDSAAAVAIQPDNRIVVGGSTWNGSGSDMLLVRYDTDGNPDPSFGGGDGIVTEPFEVSGDIGSLALYQEGSELKIVAGGLRVIDRNGFLDQDFLVARFDSTGELDGSFGTNGITTTAINTLNDVAGELVVQPDGKVILGGLHPAKARV